MLVAYGYSAYHLTPGHDALRWFAAIALPIVMITIWAMFLAPRATYHLDMPWLLIAKIIIFAGAIVMLAIAGKLQLATIFATITAIHLALATYWKQV